VTPFRSSLTLIKSSDTFLDTNLMTSTNSLCVPLIEFKRGRKFFLSALVEVPNKTKIELEKGENEITRGFEIC
jgi:hypothetical protein